MTALITIIGNTTADAELRFTASGAPVATFTVASTERVFDKQTNEWSDGKQLFMRCTAWRQLAENIAESILKGTRVMVRGKIATRSYESREGEKRTSIELEVEEIGPSLRYATAKPVKAPRGQGAGQGGGWGQQGGQQRPPQQGDPWSSGPQGQQPPQQSGWGQVPQYDEPAPF